MHDVFYQYKETVIFQLLSLIDYFKVGCTKYWPIYPPPISHSYVISWDISIIEKIIPLLYLIFKCHYHLIKILSVVFHTLSLPFDGASKTLLRDGDVH